jgi:phthiocerol/phenolphthiocerol synthesis type-I polyketide synthase E
VTSAFRREALEDRLQELWEELLEAPVTRDVGFFDAGGDSLLLGVLHDRLVREFDVDLPAVMLFDLPTIEHLAAELDERLGVQDGT